MDPRSAAALVDDPRGALAQLESVAAASFEHLAEARRFTEQEIRRKATALADADLADDMAVVLFGTWARGELTEGSDGDWAVIVAREFEPDEPAVERALSSAREHLGGEERAPGAQQVFGVAFDASGLVPTTARFARIGHSGDEVEGRVQAYWVEVRVLFGAPQQSPLRRVFAFLRRTPGFVGQVFAATPYGNWGNTSVPQLCPTDKGADMGVQYDRSAQVRRALARGRAAT
jgi:hypothetical protein